MGRIGQQRRCNSKQIMPQPLEALPDHVAHFVNQFLDCDSLLRLSETARPYHVAVTSDLFRLDICVHCSTPFFPLDNREPRCLPIRNKSHRRHKGERAANARELRRTKELVEQRLRIARGDTFHVDEDVKETHAHPASFLIIARSHDGELAGARDVLNDTLATKSRTRPGWTRCPRPPEASASA